jgi:hypothetical protein
MNLARCFQELEVVLVAWVALESQVEGHRHPFQIPEVFEEMILIVLRYKMPMARAVVTNFNVPLLEAEQAAAVVESSKTKTAKLMMTVLQDGGHQAAGVLKDPRACSKPALVTDSKSSNPLYILKAC